MKNCTTYSDFVCLVWNFFPWQIVCTLCIVFVEKAEQCHSSSTRYISNSSSDWWFFICFFHWSFL